ncbi:MAG: hypothetical protein LKG11_00095 [Bacilli bacterium]|jgi:hypothetical protein|nr:hypothetical protein [Bacilli bacterium]
MGSESLKIGRVSRKIEKAVGHEFGDDVGVYLSNEELDAFARKWPKTYLGRIEEMGRIIAKPDYAAYCVKKRVLFLIKEYLKEGAFRKVAMEIGDEGKLSMRLIYNLSDLKAKEIASETPISKVD